MRLHRQRGIVFASVCVGIVCVAACAQNTPAAGAEIRRVEEVVESLIAADIAGGLDTVVSLYADDAVLVPPGGPDVAGRDAIRDHYERLFARADLRIENETRQTIVTGNLAITRGTNRVTATPKGDAAPTTGSDKYVMILVRDKAGAWRISHLIWTPRAE